MSGNQLALKVFPMGSKRREYLAKIYRKVKFINTIESDRQGFFGGRKKFDRNKETIVLVTHQTSSTGAPLLGLNIGKKLSEKYNLINYIMLAKELNDSFVDDCFLLIEERGRSSLEILRKIIKYYNIKVVIGNSIITHSVIYGANSLGLATISLIHEFADYIYPRSNILDNIIVSDKVILPAEIILDSIIDELKVTKGSSIIPQNISIQPQGKLPYFPDANGKTYSIENIYKRLGINSGSQYKVIVAAGTIDIRKGVDLFISVARYIKKISSLNYKFVWVGERVGDNAAFDQVFFERQLKQFNLQNEFIFLNHQQSLDNIFSIADLFCMSSRLDPFPNVVIDALEADLPIACFKGASGCVKFLEDNNADCVLASYLDTYELAEKIVYRLENSSCKKEFVNSTLVSRALSFDKYVDFLDRKIEEAYAFNKQNLQVYSNLKKASFFDKSFAGVGTADAPSLYHSILLSRKGLVNLTTNPKPGFSNLKWILDSYCGDCTVPMEQAIAKGVESTHNSHILSGKVNEGVNLRVAVHLHLYYIDLSDEFVEYFKHIPVQYDLYITIVKSESAAQVEKSFKGCGAANIKVIIVENIGRDVAPMIFDLKPYIADNNYDVIGHFHSKKSLDTNSDMGDRWRRYLLDNLIGKDTESATEVLSLFNDGKVGLVFPDDRHYIDIGKNKEYLASLCNMIGIKTVRETPVFPLGNMFWARANAIKDLFLLDKEHILQDEPLPYDGSYMHALERITPHLIESNGYEYITVYKSGTIW
ncbi:rhamnan synthesis F family protein [Francisella philomiragia]|uniref:rhamnan synthesis F family protein n=1 Tax=Francisella philomiragia TaxID=28110 RepID=UPI0035119D58